MTPVMIAARRGYINIIQLLVLAGTYCWVGGEDWRGGGKGGRRGGGGGGGGRGGG